MRATHLTLLVALLACPAAAQVATQDAADPADPATTAAPGRPAPTAPADRPARPAPRRPGATALRGERLARILQLTPDQRRQLAEIRRATRDEVRMGRDHLRTLRAQLREALDAPQSDAQRIGSTMLELRAVRQQLAATRRAVLQKLSSVLDQRQRQALAALRDARRAAER